MGSREPSIYVFLGFHKNPLFSNIVMTVGMCNGIDFVKRIQMSHHSQDNVSGIIGTTQKCGYRLHNILLTSCVVYTKNQCCCMFRGSAIPLYKVYRLEYDYEEDKITFYVIYFLFFKKILFVLRHQKGISHEEWRNEYKKLLQQVRGV